MLFDRVFYQSPSSLAWQHFSFPYSGNILLASLNGFFDKNSSISAELADSNTGLLPAPHSSLHWKLFFFISDLWGKLADLNDEMFRKKKKSHVKYQIYFKILKFNRKGNKTF